MTPAPAKGAAVFIANAEDEDPVAATELSAEATDEETEAEIEAASLAMLLDTLARTDAPE